MFSSVACRNMLSRSLRSSSTFTSCSCASRIQITTSIRTLSKRSHQRRSSSSSSSSSSKPSNIPPHGTRVVSQQRQETSSKKSSDGGAQIDGGRRSTTRHDRRKARQAAAEASLKGQEEFLRNLPSVPNTNHVHPSDIATSDFFSLHRPISITSYVPTTANGNAFESIFRPVSEPVNPSEVISTISNTLSTLEEEASPQQQSRELRSYDNAADNEFRAATASVSTTNGNHNDEASSLALVGQGLSSGRYRPFVPPPVPVPKDRSDASDNNISAESSPSSTSATPIRKKTYTTLITILEATHPNGQKTYTARTAPIMIKDVSSPSASSNSGSLEDGNIVSSTTPTVFLERMWSRQQQWEEYRRSIRDDQGGIWEAISVKRQRRLKMKKHKYKKLMRKTRNLRRRMEKN